MAFSTEARRAIAIRHSIKRRAANDTGIQASNDNRAPRARRGGMHPRLLAMCIEAGGFDENARYGS